jgi:hypothetical protein
MGMKGQYTMPHGRRTTTEIDLAITWGVLVFGLTLLLIAVAM